MNDDVITIDCHCEVWSLLFFVVEEKLQYEKLGYEVTSLDNGDWAIGFLLDGRKVTINVKKKWHRVVDVCVVDLWVHDTDFIHDVRRHARQCKHNWPTAPIIVASDAEWKNDPETMREAELEGWNIINQKMGNKLAREVGASKYLECSSINGRGIKILFDEIAYAYFAKLKDEEERRESDIREKDEIEKNKIENERIAKFHRDLLFFFVSAFSILLFSITLNIFMIKH